MKRLVLIALIFASSIHAQDSYFDKNAYHKVDCSQIAYCEVTSFEEGLVWDSKVYTDILDRGDIPNARHNYYARYEGKRYRVFVRFETGGRLLHAQNVDSKTVSDETYIDLRCKLTEKDQYVCRYMSR